MMQKIAIALWLSMQQAVRVGDHSTPWWVYAIVAGVAVAFLISFLVTFVLYDGKETK